MPKSVSEIVQPSSYNFKWRGSDSTINFFVSVGVKAFAVKLCILVNFQIVALGIWECTITTTNLPLDLISSSFHARTAKQMTGDHGKLKSNCFPPC